jgi:hypothetical protein
MHKNRPSGWLLPDATWHPCEPWEHIRAVKQIAWLLEQRSGHYRLNQCWDLQDDEPIRHCLARMGLVKISYNLVDADSITMAQLRALQDLYRLHEPDTDLEFIGGIRMRLELSLFLKLKSPDRLNTLGSFS